MSEKKMPVSPGRPRGTRNQNTVHARRSIAMFVEKNVPRFTGWLDKVANGIPKVDKEGNTLRDNAGSVIYLIKPDPLGALKIVGDLTEYHLPKLVRQDVQLTGTVAHLDGSELTAAQLADMSLSDLKRLALEHFQQAVQRGDTIDVVDVEADTGRTAAQLAGSGWKCIGLIIRIGQGAGSSFSAGTYRQEGLQGGDHLRGDAGL